jgi:hypothetical protein
LPGEETKRKFARAATVACLLMIVVLAALTFGGGQVNPLQILVSALAFGGMGFNIYFLYRWFRALVRGGRKRTILLIGGAWLVVSGSVLFIAALIGFGGCAGGCTSGGPGLAGLVFMLATWGIGVAFKRWLDRVRT